MQLKIDNMDNIIQWQALAYKFSISKALSNCIDILINPGENLQHYSKYEYLYNEYTAIYKIYSDCLVIEDFLVKSKKREFKFDKIVFFTRNIAPATEAAFDKKFEILYLAFKRGFYKKYIPILVPPDIAGDVINKLSASIKFYDNDVAKEKIQSHLVKIFFYLLIAGFVIWGLALTIFRFIEIFS